MDLIGLGGLISLLHLELESLIKVDSNISIDSLMKFNIPIYIIPNGIQIDNPKGEMVSRLISALLLPEHERGLRSRTSVASSQALGLPTSDSTAGAASRVSLPFRQGLHYLINQRDWWQQGQQITINNTKLVPCQYNQDINIARTAYDAEQPSFWVNANGQGKLGFELSPRSFGPLPIIDNLQPLRLSSTISYRFSWHEANSTIQFRDSSATVISFDNGVVSGAWLIEFVREQRPPAVWYVLVFPANNT